MMTDTAVHVSMLATCHLEQGNEILNGSSANMEGNTYYPIFHKLFSFVRVVNLVSFVVRQSYGL